MRLGTRQISQSVVRLFWADPGTWKGKTGSGVGDREQQGRGDAVVLFCPRRPGLAPVTTVSGTYGKAGRAAAYGSTPAPSLQSHQVPRPRALALLGKRRLPERRQAGLSSL